LGVSFKAGEQSSKGTGSGQCTGSGATPSVGAFVIATTEQRRTKAANGGQDHAEAQRSNDPTVHGKLSNRTG
jgi:hypothetical protein